MERVTIHLKFDITLVAMTRVNLKVGRKLNRTDLKAAKLSARVPNVFNHEGPSPQVSRVQATDVDCWQTRRLKLLTNFREAH